MVFGGLGFLFPVILFSLVDTCIVGPIFFHRNFLDNTNFTHPNPSNMNSEASLKGFRVR